MKIKKWKILKNIWVGLGLLFGIWLIYSMQAAGVDKHFYIDSAKTKVVQSKDCIAFFPAKTSKNVLILFPGSLVDPDAYVPLCRKIADKGVQSYIVKMPFRQTILGYKKPLELGLMKDQTKKYILAGHSQGGKMAARFVLENPKLISKLILLGTTHPKDFSLAGSQTVVMKISGTVDGVAKYKDVLANQRNLPKNTRYVTITGGNHSQFGYYGFQLGDGSAQISREVQQEIILKAIMEFIGPDH